MAPCAFPGGTHSPGPPGQWQVLFDGGHQQRYLPDRQAVLRYVLAVGPRAASPRFEVLSETGRVRLADGTDGGRQFALVEVIDLARPGRDRPPAPGTGRHVSDSPRPPQAPGKIIPLMPGISRGGGERREMLRAAVIQVVQHLVLRAVPPSRRVPLFEQATGLLDEAGWGLDELAEAAEPGPAQDALLRTLGLMDT